MLLLRCLTEDLPLIAKDEVVLQLPRQSLSTTIAKTSLRPIGNRLFHSPFF